MSIVKLRALKKIGKKHGCILLAAQIDEFNYRTGQHYDIKNPTKPYLSLKEMTGEVPLSPEKATIFPYVINPFVPVRLVDGQSFDKTNPKDLAILEFIKLNMWNETLILNKSDKDYSKTEWLLEDIDNENTILVEQYKLKNEAMTIVATLSIDEKLRLANYINIFKGDVKLSKKENEGSIIARLFEYSDIDPQLIIDSQKRENKELLYVAELVEKGIIRKSSSDFYDGTMKIASNFIGLVVVYRTDLILQQKWDVAYKSQKERPFSVTDPVNVEKVNINTQEFLEAIIAKDKKSLTVLVEMLKKSTSSESKQLLAKWQYQINEIINPVPVVIVKKQDIEENKNPIDDISIVLESQENKEIAFNLEPSKSVMKIDKEANDPVVVGKRGRQANQQKS